MRIEVKSCGTVGLGHEHPGLFPVQKDRAEQCEDARWMEEEKFWKSSQRVWKRGKQNMSWLSVVQGGYPDPF